MSVGEKVGCPLWGRLNWCSEEIGLMHCRWRTSVKHAKSTFIWGFFQGVQHGGKRLNWVTTFPYKLVSHTLFSFKLSKFYFNCSDTRLSVWGSVRRTCAWKPLESICIACEERFAFIYKPVSALVWLAAFLRRSVKYEKAAVLNVAN